MYPRLLAVLPCYARPAMAWDSTATVVSGLPRAGTSMMMQMLAAGGPTGASGKPPTPGARSPPLRHAADPADDARLSELFARHLAEVEAFLRGRPSIDRIDVDYSEAV